MARRPKIVLDDAVGFIVFRAHQAMRQELYRVFREHGVEMTPEQWVVLVRLWERDGRSQNELCDATFRDRPTMSRMLDGMERNGWVERLADPDDARARIVRLTAAGKGLEARFVPLTLEIVGRVLDGISERDLQTTFKTLRKMTNNLLSPRAEGEQSPARVRRKRT